MHDLNLGSCRLLIVGINPGLWTERVDAPFARPGNRFWPALHAAGITQWLVDAREGLSHEDAAMLARRGLGFTNVVARATAVASELSREEIRAGGAALDSLVAEQRAARGGPQLVMVAGIGVYRTAFSRPKARVGLQDHSIGGAETWVVPNPSGLNAHETVDSLARAYAQVYARLT
ncbi:mismatch-specific DNA-glycosylase [Corynebacterium comes]|uniref:G/U mismatch-specific DNA glycosylase n=1 Tax=Corynebacterium comes TaxID=2675218 RepID=A0A6B8VMR2_9CORY|nr:mismatch-specific DNA-glycosylase [Corynebacterium comes]QGU04399.1 G/U mismatch-specific DNA glycosylase [Corynebacterium comes]